MTPLTIERLRQFYAVASHGTIAAAARETGYTPSAVSQQLAALERELGTSLLERSNRGVTLTPAGVRLSERALTILDLVQTASVEATRSGPEAEPIDIRIGAFPTAISSIIVPAMPALAPLLHPTIVHLEPEQALTELVARRLDAAVIDFYDNQPEPKRSGLHLVKLLTDKLRLAITNDRQPPRAVTDLADVAWVLGGSHSRLGRATQAVLGAAGIAPRLLVESDDHWLTFDIMRGADAATVLPELALRTAPAHIVPVHGIELGCDRHIYLVTREVIHPHPALVTLEATLVDTACALG